MSLRLLRPAPLSPSLAVTAMQRVSSGSVTSSSRELLDALAGTSGSTRKDEELYAEVLRLVVRGADFLVGIRAEKGLALRGSMSAVKASGSDGATFCSIKPAALWGVGQDKKDGGLTALDYPEGDVCCQMRYGGGRAGAMNGRGFICSSSFLQPVVPRVLFHVGV